MATAALVVAVAGPGSGKTGVLIERYGHFRELSAETVILTFTTAAAAEIRHRIEAREWALPVFVGTLHSWCARLLMIERPAMRILDEEEAEALRKEAAAEMRMTVGDLREAMNAHPPKPKGQQLLVWYWRKLQLLDSEDFDTLLLAAYRRLQKEPVRVSHLMIDEYQDSTEIDHAIYSAIHTRMRFVVGDPDQSIYNFRGSSAIHLREMAGAHGAYTQFMRENFRCCHAVCAMASHIIARGKPREEEATRSATGITGEVHVLEPFLTMYQEQAAIVEWALPDMSGSRAVLCRYNHQVSAIQQALIVAGVRTPVIEPEHLGVTCREVRETVQALARSQRGGLRLQEMRRFWVDNKVSLAMRNLIAKSGLESAPELALWLTTWEREQREKTTAGNISVCTVHAAKGLEWDHVWIAGADDGAFPAAAAELLYVAATRARLSLCISHAARRPAFTGATTMLAFHQSPLLLP